MLKVGEYGFVSDVRGGEFFKKGGLGVFIVRCCRGSKNEDREGIGVVGL